MLHINNAYYVVIMGPDVRALVVGCGLLCVVCIVSKIIPSVAY